MCSIMIQKAHNKQNPTQTEHDSHFLIICGVGKKWGEKKGGVASAVILLDAGKRAVLMVSIVGKHQY